MKMGTIRSPWRYEKPAGFVSNLANGTKPRGIHYAAYGLRLDGGPLAGPLDDGAVAPYL
jgi:hypothetical protein